MKVKGLIKLLKPYEDKDVVFSQDEEGNGFMSDCQLGIGNNKKTIIIYPFQYVEVDE